MRGRGVDGQWIVHDRGFGATCSGAGAVVLGLGGPARARRRGAVTTFHRIDWNYVECSSFAFQRLKYRSSPDLCSFVLWAAVVCAEQGELVRVRAR